MAALLSRLSTVVGVITGHYSIGTHERRIGLGHLGNYFCRSCVDEEENETVLYLLCTCPALGRRKKSHLGAFYMENLNKP